jgi:radical SAM superfamily enzyme
LTTNNKRDYNKRVNKRLKGVYKPMSRHITVQCKYRNGRINSVGCHQPSNGDFTEENRQHLINMLDKYIKPKKDKYKNVKFIYTYEGTDFYDVTLNQNILDGNTSTLVNNLINLYNAMVEDMK